jgi:hypothetical protein
MIILSFCMSMFSWSLLCFFVTFSFGFFPIILLETCQPPSLLDMLFFFFFYFITFIIFIIFFIFFYFLSHLLFYFLHVDMFMNRLLLLRFFFRINFCFFLFFLLLHWKLMNGKIISKWFLVFCHALFSSYNYNLSLFYFCMTH